MQIGAIQSRSAGLGAAVSKASNAVYFDPMDTNRDGVVSPAEEFAYTLTHPKWEPKSSSTASSSPLNHYTQSGGLKAAGKSIRSQFDVYI